MGKRDTDTENLDASKLDYKIATWCWMVVKRHLNPADVFFEEGDTFLRLASRYLPLDDTEHEGFDCKKKKEFPCGHARCGQTFDSLIKYETHYNLSHRNVCGTCYRIFPSAHLLDLHILETHDVMFSLLAEKTKMYQCYIEGCEEKFINGKVRHQHLIQYHHYPANYRYRHTDAMKSKKGKSNKPQANPTKGNSQTASSKGISKTRSGKGNSQAGLCTGNSQTGSGTENSQTGSLMEISDRSTRDVQTGVILGECMDLELDPVVTSKPQNIKLQEPRFKPRVPSNICFGQGVGRGFQREKSKQKKHWHSLNKGTKTMTMDIENVDLKDMSAALDIDV